MRRIAIATGFLLLAAPAFASTGDVPGCADAGDGAASTACVLAAQERIDRELNAYWPIVLAAIEARGDPIPADEIAAWKETMIAAQRDWVAFRDRDCEAVAYEWWGGPGASQAKAECLYWHTAARLEDLRERYTDR